MATKKKKPPVRETIWDLRILPVLAITLVAYIPSINNGFLNWDDIIYVMNNDMIKKMSAENITRMFSTFYMGNYHPFIILSFAFDYSLFGMNATGYHVHNLILHLANTFLVYAFFYYLFNRKPALALIVAALFAIHPLHVESVAWISERKDLLYTFYFMLALVSYLFYTEKKEMKYLVLSVLLFVFSLLAKAQAVTLPLVLILADYLLSRKITLKTILEKVPFFILSLVFGLIAIRAQDADSSINPIGISVFHSLFYAHYSIWVYLFKLVLPVFQTCLYEYPKDAAGNPPFYIFLSPLIIPILGYVLYKTWQTRKYVTFGLLFFLFTIFPVLQFLPVGQAIVAERYTYIPYIGLFIVAGGLFLEARQKVKGPAGRSVLTWTGYAVICLLAVLTFGRTKVWYDSVSLWTDVLEKNPKSVTAYVNRGYMYNQYNEYEKAIEDCNTGIRIDSNHYKFYVNRGVSYRNTGRYELALADFTRSIQKNPKNYETYLDRGILFTDQFNQYDSGIASFRVYMRFRPSDVNGYRNMAVAFYKKKMYDSAAVYCRKGMEINPAEPGPYYIMALVSEMQGDYANAALFGSKAQDLGYAVDAALMERWRAGAGIVPVNTGR